MIKLDMVCSNLGQLLNGFIISGRKHWFGRVRAIC